ncbi:hypothetical protein AWH62_09765 [Maricaulis sp. W15]|uniref:hypothetical protein n=1 Tax=Maricaulis sp. W15 TaxID=1772333 RepID=UPI0009490FAC|nr:hypothetical protein [Maricaulis sp. W15]OLF73209.1 hypothetical protein AWH62_09765 [Maricaulis sp. W15]
MKPERIHLTIGLLWLILGMLLGEHMGRSGDHTQMPTHAHMMLLGGVLPILWAILYRVFKLANGLLAWAQVGLHHVAVLVMIPSLYLMFGQMVDEAAVGPLLGISAIMAIVSVALVLVLSLRAKD